MGSNRFCSSFLPNGCKDIHFGAVNYLAQIMILWWIWWWLCWEWFLMIMIVMMRQVTVSGMTLLTGRMDHDEWSRPLLEVTPRHNCNTLTNTRKTELIKHTHKYTCRQIQANNSHLNKDKNTLASVYKVRQVHIAKCFVSYRTVWYLVNVHMWYSQYASMVMHNLLRVGDWVWVCKAT